MAGTRETAADLTTKIIVALLGPGHAAHVNLGNDQNVTEVGKSVTTLFNTVYETVHKKVSAG